MPVGELFLCAFLQVLFDRLACRELLDLARQEGLCSKLEKWEKKLKMIQTVLDDAEEKQLTNKAVKLWLENLKDLAYDAEDILDEFATEAYQRNLMAEHQASTSKAGKLIRPWFKNFTPSAMKFDFSMRRRIKGITTRLEELYKERDELGLQIIPGGTPNTVLQRQSSTSVPTEPAVYGRDGDKAKILEWVLTDEPTESNFRVIAIVGMGGIGKTTLAREVYNDKSVDAFKFDIKAWVCVSDDFDVMRISKAILKSATFSSCSSDDLNEVQVQLRNAINGKKFMLILDDVWNKSYGLWETLKAPLKASAPGSKLIVTTRLADVASTMGSIKHYTLKGLSDDDCWSLFVKHAFQNRDIGSHQCSEFNRKRVVEKCKGLPLVARTLGGLIHSKPRDDAWEDILNSKIWYLIDGESEILPVLKLSYHHLPAYLKRCFTYCAIFPKNYIFDEKELVLLWIAEGFVQQSTTNERLEDLGCKYFQDLLSRSLFQQLSNNNSKFVMHDLIHDLAQLVSGDTSFRSEEANKQKIRFESTRHASYIGDDYDKIKFEVFQRFDHLRTFLHIYPFKSDTLEYLIPPTVLYDFMRKSKKLWVFSLRNNYIAHLPESIGGMRHLRYLNLSFTMIKNLPESTSSLFNLQVLLLQYCRRLMKLPSKMKDLINLRHLDISGKNLLEEMPLGMKELKDLQMLSNFIVGKGNGSGLKDLKHLKFLRSELCISRLENASDLRGTKEMILSYHKDLEVLSLLWQRQFDESRNEKEEENVLHMLQPHGNLKELTITNYYGAKFPSWVGDSLFSNMVVLELRNCEKCKTIPPLGLLGSLKELSIIGMASIKCLGSEFYGEHCLKPFQSLDTLYFKDLQQLECWESINGNKHIERFPCLRVLSIVNCPKLTGKLPDYLPSLEELVIKQCAQLVFDLQQWECWESIKRNQHIERLPRLRVLSIKSCPKLTWKLPDYLPSLEKLVIKECAQLVVAYTSFPKLYKLKIDGCKGIVCNGSPIHSKSLNSMTLSKVSEIENWSKQGCFHSVRTLNINDCEGLIYLWKNVSCVEKPLQGMNSFSSLKSLCIRNCTSLDLFPEANFLSNLSSLFINNCKALKSLHEGMKHNNTCLKSLTIASCDSMTFIVKGMLPSSLESLVISDCKKLECLVNDRDDTSISTSSSSSSGQLPISLKSLDIRICPKLESIAERFYDTTCLGHIYLIGCENLKSIPEGLHHLSCLQCLYIKDCPSIVSFPKRGLPNTSLTSLDIDSCEKLEALPDCMHNVSSLQHLSIRECPSIKSFGIPTNLNSLSISGGLKIYKLLIEWGLHKLTCLRTFSISTCLDAISFPPEETEMILPTSLSVLYISNFPKLKYLSSTAFQSLTSLKRLLISGCPELKSFPMGLPSSLLHLQIFSCPLLKKGCKRDQGKELSKIAYISDVEIDGKYIDEI